MPPKRRSNEGQFTLSYKTLGAFLALITVIGIIWSAVGKVATKEDIDRLAASYTTNYQGIEGRVRNLEIQFATFFGKTTTTSVASPTILKPSASDDDASTVQLLKVQYGGGGSGGQYNPDTSASSSAVQRPYVPPQRRIVVTMDFIKMHELEPVRGGSYGLLGEDGQYYSIDDVLAVLIREHQQQHTLYKKR